MADPKPALETRGRKTMATLVRSGTGFGLMRDIVRESLVAAEQSADDGLVGDLFDLFKKRSPEVSSTPINLRNDGAKVTKIKKLATKLRCAIDDLRPDGDFLYSVMVARDLEVEEHESEERRLEIEDLMNWLTALERVEQAFTPYRPARDYRDAIRAAKEIFGKNGVAVRIHENSWFVKFLVALDERLPGLVFPPKTVPSGRYEYIRNVFRR